MTEDTEGDLEFQPANWYVCATCEHCGLSIPLAEVVPRSPGSSAGSMLFRNVSCPHCKETADYSVEWLMERLQAYLWGLSSTALH
jgi:hypothetical protein